ncbi:MAG: hypothetical protein AAFW82_06095, partial [Pseudomonadota bacterium]
RISTLYPYLKRVEQAWAVTQGHRRSGANHDHSAALERNICTLVVKTLDHVRGWDNAFARQPRKYKMSSPEAVQAYQTASANVVNVARQHPKVRYCNQLTHEQRMHFVAAIYQTREEKNKLRDLALNRRSGTIGWSSTFAIELYPLPLKVEFLNGSVKLKLSTKLGRYPVDVQTGPTWKGPKSYNGLQYFQLRTPDGRAYVFDIRGVAFDIQVPAGEILVDGPWLTFTCSTACSNQLKLNRVNLSQNSSMR